LRTVNPAARSCRSRCANRLFDKNIDAMIFMRSERAPTPPRTTRRPDDRPRPQGLVVQRPGARCRLRVSVAQFPPARPAGDGQRRCAVRGRRRRPGCKRERSARARSSAIGRTPWASSPGTKGPRGRPGPPAAIASAAAATARSAGDPAGTYQLTARRVRAGASGPKGTHGQGIAAAPAGLGGEGEPDGYLTMCPPTTTERSRSDRPRFMASVSFWPCRHRAAHHRGTGAEETSAPRVPDA